MYPLFFDSTMLLLIPAMAFAFWAQWKVKHIYRHYSKVASRSGMTGARAARYILDSNGLNDVDVEQVPGELTDHYDPKDRKIRLSEGIFGSHSLAALAVAAHESGHAVQDKVGYAAMNLRARLVPVANFGSTLAIPLFFIGLFMPAFKWLMDVGIIFFTGAVLFHIVTLPVEFDASRRAIRLLSDSGYLAPDEVGGARKVLSAAAWTYVAAATVSLIHLLRLVLIRNSRN